MNKTTKSKRTAVDGSDQRLVRRWLRINYGVNRREKGKTLHAYGKLRCKGDWSADDTHRHIRTLILKRHPGWMLTGYALISPNDQEHTPK
jgi:hypothetical protein